MKSSSVLVLSYFLVYNKAGPLSETVVLFLNDHRISIRSCVDPTFEMEIFVGATLRPDEPLGAFPCVALSRVIHYSDAALERVEEGVRRYLATTHARVAYASPRRSRSLCDSHELSDLDCECMLY